MSQFIILVKVLETALHKCSFEQDLSAEHVSFVLVQFTVNWV